MQKSTLNDCAAWKTEKMNTVLSFSWMNVVQTGNNNYVFTKEMERCVERTTKVCQEIERQVSELRRYREILLENPIMKW